MQPHAASVRASFTESAASRVGARQHGQSVLAFGPRRFSGSARVCQAVAFGITPFSSSSVCNSPAWNISVTMSQPPTNSPFT